MGKEDGFLIPVSVGGVSLAEIWNLAGVREDAVGSGCLCVAVGHPAGTQEKSVGQSC